VATQAVVEDGTEFDALEKMRLDEVQEEFQI
jgi:hypothetical protein